MSLDTATNVLLYTGILWPLVSSYAKGWSCLVQIGGRGMGSFQPLLDTVVHDYLCSKIFSKNRLQSIPLNSRHIVFHSMLNTTKLAAFSILYTCTIIMHFIQEQADYIVFNEVIHKTTVLTKFHILRLAQARLWRFACASVLNQLISLKCERIYSGLGHHILIRQHC